MRGLSGELSIPAQNDVSRGELTWVTTPRDRATLFVSCRDETPISTVDPLRVYPGLIHTIPQNLLINLGDGLVVVLRIIG